MSGFSDYLENKMLEHIFGKSIFEQPVIYIGLSTTDPGDDGLNLNEPQHGSYERVFVSAESWSSVINGSISNLVPITFAQALGDWGVVGFFAIFDASASGNLLAYGQLENLKNLTLGAIARFESGDLKIELE